MSGAPARSSPRLSVLLGPLLVTTSILEGNGRFSFQACDLPLSFAENWGGSTWGVCRGRRGTGSSLLGSGCVPSHSLRGVWPPIRLAATPKSLVRASFWPPQVPLPHRPARSAFMKLLLRAGIRDDLDAISVPRRQFNRLGHLAGPGAPQRGEQASGNMKALDGIQPRGESPLKFSGSKNNPSTTTPSPARMGSALLRNWKFILTAENGPWKAS